MSTRDFDRTTSTSAAARARRTKRHRLAHGCASRCASLAPVLAPGLALVLALGGCASENEAPVQNVVLVTLDTTRADALGCYGAEGDPTPVLDALAAEGTLFENASTAVPMTLPSHCSMLTGLYPPRHTVRDNGYWPLPQSATTLAERLADADVTSAAFLAAVVLDRPFALDQGFDVYDAPSPEPGADALHGERSGPDVVARALDWLAQRDPQRRFFLWVHLFDPHTPYAPLPGGREDLPPYAAEVAQMDAELGKLFGALRADGTLEETLVLVVGDHGEAFGEHGEETHGDFIYEPTMHVPFLMRGPRDLAQVTAGRREAGLVSIVDVYPTVLSAFGLEPADDVDGIDLLAGPIDPERGVYFESYAGYFSQGWSPLAGWRDGSGKYLHSSRPEFFDVDADPEESRNLVAERDDLRRYRLALAELAAAPSLSAEQRAGVDDALLDQIRGLGYAALGGAYDAVPEPLAPSERPAPQDMAEWSHRALDAANAVVRGEYAAAEPELRAVLEANPLNFVALHHLAYALIFQERHAEAIAPLRTLLAEGPKKAEWFEQLASCLHRTGDTPGAIDAMKQAVAIEPENERYRATLVGILRFAGREEEAASFEQ